jgi:hypothetical protein
MSTTTTRLLVAAAMRLGLGLVGSGRSAGTDVGLLPDALYFHEGERTRDRGGGFVRERR